MYLKYAASVNPFAAIASKYPVRTSLRPTQLYSRPTVLSVSPMILFSGGGARRQVSGQFRDRGVLAKSNYGDKLASEDNKTRREEGRMRRKV